MRPFCLLFPRFMPKGEAGREATLPPGICTTLYTRVYASLYPVCRCTSGCVARSPGWVCTMYTPFGLTDVQF